MAKIYDVNNIMGVNGGAEAMFRFKETAKAASWTVPSSSDGTTYNSSGDQITAASTGAGGMNNDRAWFIVRDPGGRREYCCQRGTSTNEHLWRVKYSALAKFSSGSPSATQVPAATDESTALLGSGTDASPTMAQFFPVGGGYRYHIIFQSTVVGADSYGFWSIGTTSPAGAGTHCFMGDPMDPGSYPVEDVDPMFVRASYAAINTWNVSIGKAWYLYGLVGATFSNLTPTTAGGVVLALVANGYNGKDPLLPILYLASTSPYYKGNSAFLRYKAVSVRAYPDTVDVTSDARVYVDGHAIPWPDNVAPIL